MTANRLNLLALSDGTEGNYTLTRIAYGVLTNNTVYTKDAGYSKALFPKIDLVPSRTIVASTSTLNGIGSTNTANYTYGGLKAELGTGRGMLGFRWIKSQEAATGIERYTEYRQDFPFTGMPIKSETRLAGQGNGGVLKRTTVNSLCKIPMNGAACVVQINCHKADSDASIKNACISAANARYFPYVASTQEDSWDLNGAAYPSVTSSTDYGLDPVANGQLYGDVSTITVGTSDGASKTTTNEYYPADTTNWILGRLKQATVTSVQR